MRFFTFAAVTVAFVASVSAKVGLGACPTDLPMIDWTEYTNGNTGFAQDHFYHHEIIAMDSQFEQLVALAEKFGAKIPVDIDCADLGTVPPFNQIAAGIKEAADAASSGQTAANGVNFNYPAQQVFETLFPTRDDAVVKMVDIVNTRDAEAEFYYVCIDSFSFPAVLAQVRGMGIPIPPEAIKVIDVVNKLSVVLKKLNLTLKLEGGVVIGARPADAAAVSVLETAFSNDTGKYSFGAMKVLDKSVCPV
jgi:hypothetical protein